jgi:hypothetical protein
MEFSPVNTLFKHARIRSNSSGVVDMSARCERLFPFKSCRYDLVIDSDLKVWLIEINCSPAMDASTKVHSRSLFIFCYMLGHLLPDNGAPLRGSVEGVLVC